MFLTRTRSLLGMDITAASSTYPVNPTLANNSCNSFCPSLQLHPCIFTSVVSLYSEFFFIHLNFFIYY
ncbi:MAG: hypothetical protein ACFFB0_20595 [Promethearchaeota archaeon]